jgi:hypothetical protein
MDKPHEDIRISLMSKAIEKLRDCASDDIEARHMRSDDILCELLRQLGYLEVVDEYEKLPKWYA